MSQDKAGFTESAKTRFLAYSLFHSLQDLDLRSARYLLIEKKADPNYLLDEFGVAPIHIAAGVGSEMFGIQAVQMCLACGGDPNVQSVDGFTPVHVAAIWKRIRVLELLVNHGGDICLPDDDGITPLQYALKANCLELSKSSCFGKSVQETTAQDSLYLEVPSRVKLSGIDCSLLGEGSVGALPASPNSECYFSASSKTTAHTGLNRFERPQGKLPNLDSSRGGEGLVESPPSVASRNSESFLSASVDSKNDTLNNGFLANDCDEPNYDFSDVESASFFETYPPIEGHSKPNQSFSSSTAPHLISTTDENSMIHPWSPDSHASREPTEGLCLARFKDEIEENVRSRISLLPRLSATSGTYYEALDFATDRSVGTVSTCPTERLKYLLQERQIEHGPIVKSTKRVYLYQLKKTKNAPLIEPLKIQRLEFNDVVISTFSDRLFEYIDKWSGLESEMVECLENAKPEPKLDQSKQYFTYLLLDPLVSDLMGKRDFGKDLASFWPEFLKSVFYIGKGKNSRPLDHLIDAIRSNKPPASEKIKKIKNIWAKGVGVVTIHVFHNISEAEALTREACMILALSNARLTNVQSGRCYGGVQKWALKRKRQLGTVLLYRAMNMMVAEGVRQLYPSDLKK